MANFSKLIITDAGKQLLNLKLGSDEELIFAEMVMSEQSYDIAALEELAELNGVRQRTNIRKMSRVDNVIQIDSVFLNSDLEEGYFVNTLGVYARLGEDTPILFAVAIEQTRAAYMPQKSQTLSGMEIKLKITLENADNITIQVDQSAMATVGDVLELESSIKNHAGDFDNPHHISKEQVGLGNADNTSDMCKPVSTAQQTAIDAAYQQATGYTDQKVADLINGAPSTLDTLGEIAQAMKDNVDVVQALDRAIGTKASQAQVDGHTGNNTIHIMASERQAWNSKQTTTGDTKDNTISFTSGDSSSPTGWADVGVMASGEAHSSIFRKISLLAKNLRYIWKLMGNTSLSGIGDGTLTGAVNALNTRLSKNINDTGWLTINESWGCKYRFRDGVVYIAINTDFTNVPSVTRHSLGTIPMSAHGALNIPYHTVRESFGNGVLIVSHSAPNKVEFEVFESTKWYNTIVSIPVGYF